MSRSIWPVVLARVRAWRWMLAAVLAGCGAAPMHAPPPTLGPAGASMQPAPEAASGFESRAGVLGDRHMVASANPLASDAGLRILRAGGSAVDAAIAVQMVLTLVEPQSSGIGGGLFLMHHDGRRVQAFDGRETAPAEATPDLFLVQGQAMPFMQAVVGGRAVGTPGVLRALELAHAQHGRLPWRALFQPAITLAEDGFPVSPRLATLLRTDGARHLRQDPRAAALYFTPDGSPLVAGQPLHNLELAATLRAVAERGSVALHEGEIAREIVAAVRGHPTNPGRLSEADLSGYRAVLREPLCFDHRAWRICGMPPPSSGTLAIAQMLGMLAGRDLAAVPPVPAPWGREAQPQAVHLLSEAGRLAYADRARYVADPDFVALPGGDASALLSERYLQSRATRIGERSMGHAMPGTPLPNAFTWADDRSPELPSTSHVSVVDGFGNSLSMTTTIENAFGAQIMVRGFLLNNQLTDFSFVPDDNGMPVANRVQPGKRPRSSMTPLLVFDRDSGALVMSVGSPGGSAIINYVAKVLVATLVWDMDLQSAIALPNFGSRNGPTELERGRVSSSLIAGLEARGHQITLLDQTSGLQGIARVKRDGRDRWLGAADPRREGAALGD